MSEKTADTAATARDEAIEWSVRMDSGKVDEALMQAHREWLAADDANRQAWECLQAVDQQFASLSGGSDTRRVLHQTRSHRPHCPACRSNDT